MSAIPVPPPTSSESASDHQWRADILGEDFAQLTLPLSDDDEGECLATLVRYSPVLDEPSPLKRRWWQRRERTEPVVESGPERAVLYIHGWSDYFFQVGLAEHWHEMGAHFFALDLRKYGRSLRDWQTPGYIDDLATYDEEIGLALSVIRDELGSDVAISLMGHSTGGLTATLWADRHPGEISSLVLNSPWLELQGSSVLRTGLLPIITGLSKINKMHAYPNIDLGYYSRATKALGWSWNEEWRPTPTFAVRRGWLAAILTGHSKVASGLDIRIPVLLMTSARSIISPLWSDDMGAADGILDVPAVRERGLSLGPLVTLVAIPGGLHDLALSAEGPRDEFYRQLRVWAETYAWSEESLMTGPPVEVAEHPVADMKREAAIEAVTDSVESGEQQLKDAVDPDPEEPGSESLRK